MFVEVIWLNYHMELALFLKVKQVLNEAAEINQNATAQANLISAKAEADSKATVENARSAGLKLLYR